MKRAPRKKKSLDEEPLVALTFPLPDGTQFTISACTICFGNALEGNMKNHIEWHVMMGHYVETD